jgi:hypothetical protein
MAAGREFHDKACRIRNKRAEPERRDKAKKGELRKILRHCDRASASRKQQHARQNPAPAADPVPEPPADESTDHHPNEAKGKDRRELAPVDAPVRQEGRSGEGDDLDVETIENNRQRHEQHYSARDARELRIIDMRRDINLLAHRFLLTSHFYGERY